uniref:Protein kinase domain-containing protein n=1 Tax=Globisporangium ultimum (strain ATCC 200006 / CBS 805.95 / DAOM BR144) TaxID=431595 RepID=K3X279_GLOUD
MAASASVILLSNISNITATIDEAEAVAAAEQQARLAFLTQKIDVLQWFLLLGYGTMCALCVMLICYMRHNRYVAFKGDADAARKIILPAYEPLLWILGFSTGLFTLFFCVARAVKLYTWAIPKLATECFYSGRQFVFLIVVVFMLQKSVSIPALRRTVAITFALSTYTLPIVWFMSMYVDPAQFYTVLTISKAMLLLLYTYVFFRPPARASKRTLREFCVFAFVYYALLFMYNEMFRQGKTELGFALTYANLLCGSLCPLVIWRVMKADTEHWRGMGQRAVALQSLFRQRHQINERISSQGLHVLIEMHRKFIIDFAHLELKQRIGVGASALVFQGVIHSSTDVAVKMYTPSDFTEDTVAEFSHEAALCGVLNHPNIVKFFGMCVCPPTICLISELCQGSLDDVTCAMQRRFHHQNPSLSRQQLLINLGYMIDAARAVAYIHSFSPAFVHRDIKPANFLVDFEHNVKLTDFGESRSLPCTHITSQNATPATTRASRTSSISEDRPNRSPMPQQQYQQYQNRSPSLSLPLLSPLPFLTTTISKASGAQMTVRGTVDYMAPEIIQGRAGLALYGEAVDVYALAITMWDILHPGTEKFPALLQNNHLQVFEFVVDGKRPELAPATHASLREVIVSAWHQDPRLRPSAQNIVSILESIQEEVLASFAAQLNRELVDRDVDELSPSEVLSSSRSSERRQPLDRSFSGHNAVEHLTNLEYVAFAGEAIRMSNALMDAGLLHHIKHARSFEDADTERYYFDDDHIQLCQPLNVKNMLADEAQSQRGYVHVGEYAETTTGTSTTTSATRRSHATQCSSTRSRVGSSSLYSAAPFLENGGLCACRKFGQRLEIAKSSRRRFRRNHQRQNHQELSSQFHAINEESVITTKLLLNAGEDVTSTGEGDSGDFGEFDAVVINVAAA